MSAGGDDGRAYLRKVWERTRRRGPKTAAEALLVVLFLLLFLALMKITLPEGVGLQLFIRGGDEEAAGQGERLWTRDGGKILPATTPMAGYVAEMQNDVQSRRASSIAWGRAEKGMRLFPRDAVQTARNSSASIWVGGKGTVNLGEKSLMILRQMEQEVSSGAKRSILLMVEGEVRGRIEGSKLAPVTVDLESMGGVGRIVSRGGKGGAADFRVTVNPDKTTTYSVFEGSALVQGLGRSVTVGANQYTIVSRSAPPTMPADLPAAPEITGPADGVEYLFRSLPPRVRFSWRAVAPAEGFRIVLARDPEFKNVVADEWTASYPLVQGSLDNNSFVHGNLPSGSYYWRVTAKRGGIESGYPKARTVRLVRKSTPPDLRAEAAPDPVRGDWCRVHGTADPGVSLRVAGKETAQDATGAFESIVPLERGINMIVVEASDAAGNTAYRSLGVTGR